MIRTIENYKRITEVWKIMLMRMRANYRALLFRVLFACFSEVYQ